MPEPERTPRAIDPFSRDVLEFPAVLELLHRYLSGPIGEPRLERVAPGTNLEQIRRELELAREAREYLREGARPGLGNLHEPSALLEQLRVEGVALEALDILALVELARAALDMHRLLAQSAGTGARDTGRGERDTGYGQRDTGSAASTPRLEELARLIPDFRGLVTELAGKINPDGTVDSSASAELGRLRRAIERVKVEIQSSLERMLRRFSQDNVLQDAVVTIRNDRFVIPVRVEEKRRVQGVVHGSSSSGATVYVEPLETLTFNNELVELQDREFAEVQRILGEFTRKLQERREDLARTADILGEIDWAFAKGEFSRQFDCCIPEIHEERAIRLKGFRHPLLMAQRNNQNGQVTELHLELLPPKTQIIISGPNAGGKSVALKSIGIAALMAQAGIPVPAGEVRLPLFGHVLADIGDQQSIEANLSTFSAHIAKIEAMAKAVGPTDLVLLDELGASTEPNEGAALAIAILAHFRQRGAMTVVTTHHSRLKAYAAETMEAVNAAMEFDEATLEPTYRLLVGLPGKSSALDIAARLGLEASIVHHARSLLAPGDTEAAGLVAELHEQRAAMERRLDELEREKQDLAKRREQLEEEFQRERRTKLRELDSRLEGTLRQYAKAWEDSLEDLRKQSAPSKVVTRGERKAAGLVREAREEWNAHVLEALGEAEATPQRPAVVQLNVGDRVQVRNVSTPGTITALPGGDVEVAVGLIKMRVSKEEVRPVMTGGLTVPEVAVASQPSQQAVADEVNVIGTTAEEAREQVDKFLDEAFLGGRGRVRVIHGHGKGILRRTLHEMFSHHPHVEKFYAAPPQEGGTGATIVEIRN